MPTASPGLPEDSTFCPDPATLRARFDALSGLPMGLECAKGLESARLELDRELDAGRAARYIAWTRHLADPVAQRSHRHWMQVCEPEIQACRNRLDRQFLEHFRHSAPSRAAERLVLLRGRRLEWAQVNADGMLREDLILREVLELQARHRVLLPGETLPRTLPQAEQELLAAQRERRERAWRAIHAGRRQDADTLDTMMDRLIAERVSRAGLADPADWPAWRHRELGREDCSLTQCVTLRRDVAHCLQPLMSQWQEQRRQALSLSELRPWDLSVEPDQHSALLPWRNAAELVQFTRHCLARVHPEAAALLGRLEGAGLLDLENRPGKAPGAYSHPLHHTGLSFIFMNGTGHAHDLQVLLHECGHALQTWLCRDQPCLEFLECPGESAELAAFGLELLCLEHARTLWPHASDARSWRRRVLRRALESVAWCLALDEFQDALYTRAPLSADSRAQYFRTVHEKFMGTGVAWRGLETEQGLLWQQHLQLFTQPFAHTEYAIAQLGALQLWERSMDDREAAIADWCAALALGNSRSPSEVYARAGVSLLPDRALLERIVARVSEELARE
ncbi:MAG: hypothetical protein H6678_09670 [Candidatus Delongbacteria bacterium]|nr:hypothetical protein [Candidatus Delongbacteria bacterium]